ncbi:hypothetical protein TNCV_3058101 [Trichonephila clavipes]|nr:hypothetical protein TNCV_3058101 [Trichonephila clavipes]
MWNFCHDRNSAERRCFEPTVHRPKPLNCTTLLENWYLSDPAQGGRCKMGTPRGASCDGRFISVTGTQCPASVFGRLAGASAP